MTNVERSPALKPGNTRTGVAIADPWSLGHEWQAVAANSPFPAQATFDKAPLLLLFASESWDSNAAPLHRP